MSLRGVFDPKELPALKHGTKMIKGNKSASWNDKLDQNVGKIELSEEFMVTWRDSSGMSCPLCIETKIKKTKFSEGATGGVL